MHTHTRARKSKFLRKDERVNRSQFPPYSTKFAFTHWFKKPLINTYHFPTNLEGLRVQNILVRAQQARGNSYMSNNWYGSGWIHKEWAVWLNSVSGTISSLNESHKQRRENINDPGVFRKPFSLAGVQGEGRMEKCNKLKSPVGNRIPKALGYKLKSLGEPLREF